MVRIQIIDDDFWCAEAIKAMLVEIPAEMVFEYSSTPEAVDGCDIYIIDNEFGSGDHAQELVRRVRRGNPDALIMACSGTLDRIRFKDLINAGCNAVVEKGSQQDRDVMLDVIARYTLMHRPQMSRVTFGHVLTDIRGILSNWNTRLGMMHAEDSQ